MLPLTAIRLIELLAQHIAEHGNTVVAHANGDPLVRCWWDDHHKEIRVDYR